MRDRLIDLLFEIPCKADYCATQDCGRCGELDKLDSCQIVAIADHLLANGVVVPPCKVGDKIYQTDEVRIYESTVGEVDYTANKVIYVTENICFDETAIGKSIFLTKEEAEQALKGGEGK